MISALHKTVLTIFGCSFNYFICSRFRNIVGVFNQLSTYEYPPTVMKLSQIKYRPFVPTLEPENISNFRLIVLLTEKSRVILLNFFSENLAYNCEKIEKSC